VLSVKKRQGQIGVLHPAAKVADGGMRQQDRQNLSKYRFQYTKRYMPNLPGWLSRACVDPAAIRRAECAVGCRYGSRSHRPGPLCSV